jgi:transcription elongation GreA/GreB family factor
MSKAFTKESDDDGVTELPDRDISSAPNRVTAEGLDLILAAIDRHSAAHAEALAGADKEAAARAARELRYWTARRVSAQVQPPPSDPDTVAFGAWVEIEREDGRRARYRIVGEDEADPARGLLSWVSPLARAMMGKGVGEDIEAGATEAVITGISVQP